jgi:hypothetical protein
VCFIFYFVNRSHSKFKIEFESKEFKFLKDLNIGKLFSISFCPWAEILAEAQPPSASLLSQAAYGGPSTGPLSPAGWRCGSIRSPGANHQS